MVKMVKPGQGKSRVFCPKKFANFFEGFYAKSLANPSKNTPKTMQICPQNHADYDVFSSWQKVNSIALQRPLLSTINHQPACVPRLQRHVPILV
jgi:hypothetical protein